jgi:UDP-N-acetylmuramyl tripeptide synthase
LQYSAPMKLLDSRRLTGRGLYLDRPGAVLDVAIETEERDRAAAAWREAAGRLLGEVGWHGEMLTSRAFDGGLSLALSAPVDCLYSATELNEAAWAATLAELAGEPVDYRKEAQRLIGLIDQEQNPGVRALRRTAEERGLTFLLGEDQVSVGSGTGVLCWSVDSLPSPATVDWKRVHDVPMVLVTGSNGKTTVVRLLAGMIATAGLTPGTTSTDGVTVGSESLVEGDFSGPSGARTVLRSSRVEAAVLETARGGILRRGLAVERADAAVITNIAADHLGEFGVESLSDLAETKLVVTQTVNDRGTVVLNADDPELVARHSRIPAQIFWFSLDPTSPLISHHTESGGRAAVLDRNEIILLQGNERRSLMSLDEIPIAFGGAARHNVANVLAAVAVARSLGIEQDAIRTALRQFGRFPADNPGRANLFDVGGVRVLMDYAHNPHGMSALVEVARKFPAQRRLVMLGQAGDRDDEAIRELARAAWALAPDRVIAKEMDQYLRGRERGEVPQLLADEFRRLGLAERAISKIDQEIDGVRSALEWARNGDLLVLAVHQDRRAVLGLISKLLTTNWQAGGPLPQ